MTRTHMPNETDQSAAEQIDAAGIPPKPEKGVIKAGDTQAAADAAQAAMVAANEANGYAFAPAGDAPLATGEQLVAGQAAAGLTV